MKVAEYFETDNKEHWIEEIERSDWRAGAFLGRLLRSGEFFDAVGEDSRVLLLTEGDELISYCTFAEKDDIQPTDLTPWVGFVYTFPEHRGQGMQDFCLKRWCASQRNGRPQKSICPRITLGCTKSMAGSFLI